MTQSQNCEIKPCNSDFFLTILFFFSQLSLHHAILRKKSELQMQNLAIRTLEFSIAGFEKFRKKVRFASF